MGANIQMVQKVNRSRVLNYIRKNPYTSRAGIAKGTGLSTASVTNITTYLLDKKLIMECGTEEVERVGRKTALLKFSHQSYNLICVYISNTSVDVAYTDLQGNTEEHYSEDFDAVDSSRMQKMVMEKVDAILDKFGKEKILAISVTVSGLVLLENNFVLSSSLRIKDFTLIEELEAETGIPVFLYNVTQSRAIWSFCCIEQEKNENMVFIDICGGIGACQFYHGSLNNAMLGEIGHTTVEKDGEACFCGNYGCLEVMCSPGRIIRLYKEAAGLDFMPTFEEVAERYYDGDRKAMKAVCNCAEYLGIALSNIINLFNPSTLIINVGDFMPIRDIIEKARAVMNERTHPALLRNLTIQEVNIGLYETIKGNVYTLCDRLFDENYKNSIIN